MLLFNVADVAFTMDWIVRYKIYKKVLKGKYFTIMHFTISDFTDFFHLRDLWQQM